MFVSLFAAACGSSSPDSAVATSAPDVGVEYGASVDEWASAAEGVVVTEAPLTESPVDSDYDSIAWEDLIPEGFSNAEIWERYEDEFAKVEYGTPEEEALYQKVRSELDPEAVDTALNGQKVRLNGFVAPLTFDGDIVTEFLLVPFFGACIHVPPPPPNQTVLVKVDKSDGLTTQEAWGAVWVEGTMLIEAATTDLASASYAMTGDNSGVYEQT